MSTLTTLGALLALATPPDALFDPDLRWVPGDVRTTTVAVANPRGASSDLALGLSGEGDAALLGALRAEVRAESGWRPVSLTGGGTVGVTQVAARATEQVPVRVTLPRAAPQASMRQSVRLGVRVELSAVDPAATPGRAGLLPDTGARFGGAVLVLAGLLLVAGSALLRRARGGVDHG